MSPSIDILPVSEEARFIASSLLKDINVDSQTIDLLDNVTFDGSDDSRLPYLATAHKSQAASCGTHAAMSALALRIYEIRTGKKQNVSINVDAASIFLAGCTLVSLDGFAPNTKEFQDSVPGAPRGKPDPYHTPQYEATSSIYETADGRYFHFHGSLNPATMLQLFEIPVNPKLDLQQARALIEPVLKRYTADQLLTKVRSANLVGDHCLTPDEFGQSDIGKVVRSRPVISVTAAGNLKSKFIWPKEPSLTKVLDGIKVVELTRVVAAPVIGRNLAELGATVIRVIHPDLPDFSRFVQVDFNLNKRPVYMDLKSEKGKRQMQELLQDADVFVQGYRPEAVKKLGFGKEALLEISNKRGKGMIIVDESCYGLDTTSSDRPGYQQISDVLTGVAWEQGWAVGKDCPIVPFFPISDYLTGMIGTCAALQGLIQRAEQGGSYVSHASILSTNNWYRSFGTYPSSYVRALYDQHPVHDFRSPIARMIGAEMAHLRKTRPEIFDEKHFQLVENTDFAGRTARVLGPVAKFDVPHIFSSARPWGASKVGWDDEHSRLLESSVNAVLLG